MINIGLIVGGIICLSAYPGIIVGLATIILALPCAIDGLLQSHSDYVSTNAKRIVFGFAAGVGMMIYVYSLIQIIQQIPTGL